MYTLNWSAVRPWQGLCLAIIGGSGAALWPIRSIDSHVRREAVVLALEFTSSAVACLWCNPGSSDLCQPTSLCEWHFLWLRWQQYWYEGEIQPIMTRLHTPFLFLTAVSPLPAAHQATARGNKYFYGTIKYFLLTSVKYLFGSKLCWIASFLTTQRTCQWLIWIIRVSSFGWSEIWSHLGVKME